jgi:DNA-binding MarR family transcriptional regulator
MYITCITESKQKRTYFLPSSDFIFEWWSFCFIHVMIRPHEGIKMDKQNTQTDTEEQNFSVSDFPTYYFYAIQAANSAMLSQVLDQFGITVIYWRVLAVLQEFDQRSISQLARAMSINPSNLSRYLDEMEREGYVVRSHSAKDRRRVLISVSEKGQRTVDEILPAVRQLVHRNTRNFSEAEKQMLLALLRRVRDNVVNFDVI